MVITIFRSRLRPENIEEYGRWSRRMDELAAQMPGFIAIKTFNAPDGERVSIVEFESAETMLAWRNHPEHKQAQELGREKFYSEYQITVCQPVRTYSFPKKAGATH